MYLRFAETTSYHTDTQVGDCGSRWHVNSLDCGHFTVHMCVPKRRLAHLQCIQSGFIIYSSVTWKENYIWVQSWEQGRVRNADLVTSARGTCWGQRSHSEQQCREVAPTAVGRGVVSRGGGPSQERAALKFRSPVVSEPYAHRGVWLSTEPVRKEGDF